MGVGHPGSAHGARVGRVVPWMTLLAWACFVITSCPLSSGRPDAGGAADDHALVAWLDDTGQRRRLRALLLDELFPSMRRIPGFDGAVVLRRKEAGEVGFVTLTRFESLDAIRAFAGMDYETPCWSLRRGRCFRASTRRIALRHRLFLTTPRTEYRTTRQNDEPTPVVRAHRTMHLVRPSANRVSSQRRRPSVSTPQLGGHLHFSRSLVVASSPHIGEQPIDHSCRVRDIDTTEPHPLLPLAAPESTLTSARRRLNSFATSSPLHRWPGCRWAARPPAASALRRSAPPLRCALHRVARGQRARRHPRKD